MSSTPKPPYDADRDWYEKQCDCRHKPGHPHQSGCRVAFLNRLGKPSGLRFSDLVNEAATKKPDVP